MIISKVSSEVLSTTKYTYDGNVKTPTVTVKNSKGDKLVKGTDYNVSYASGRKSTGRYSVKVTLTGSYSGAKTLYFTIVPKAPTTAKTALYGYDDVKFSWAKATGASGYYVYYKKSSAADYTYAGYTTGISYKKANLADGAKYYFKVIPYKTVNGTKYKSLQYKTAYTYTLKKVSTPSVVKYSSSKVKVKWSNIQGESGYQISKSTSKTSTNIVSTYSTTAGTYKTISAAKGKTYYYKVRAYKVVNGSRVYAPWSYVKSYRLSSGSTQTTTTKVYTTATGKRYHRIKLAATCRMQELFIQLLKQTQ